MRRRWVQRWRDRLVGSGGIALGLGGILFVWAGLLFDFNMAERTTLRDARNETANLARAFEEQITREIKAVDQSLMFVREDYARNPAAFDVASWARSAAAVTDYAIQLTIVDRDGIVRANSAMPSAPPVDLSDREHIRAHMNTDRDELFISKPVIGRVSHRYSIQFTRKLFDAGGRFDGVAVVSIDPGYLTRLYASVDLGKMGAVTLFGRDGVVRAAARSGDAPQDDTLGRHIAAPDGWARDWRSRPGISPVDTDDVPRVTTFRELHAYPLIVGVGLGTDEVLSSLRPMRRTGYLVASLLTVLLIAATLAMVLHQRRHAVARERLRESERLYAEKSLLLETALEHMDQGIVMIDGRRRLQVCNQRAWRMLGLPEELAAKGTPFDEILQHQWRCGEFGTAAKLSAEVLANIRDGGVATAPHAYERTRPSGETLEIRTVPLRDGGLVRTYSDISVRRATEEELRAARDQANSATTAKSEFLATMSHEIRSPLSGLVSALDLLGGTPMEPDQAHMVSLAHASALRLLAILNQILDFSKIEAGALTLSIEPVDIRALIGELSQPHALVAGAKEVGLTIFVAPEVPHFIRTDRLRFGQIVTNLLSNAVKFTSSGAIGVMARVEKTSDKIGERATLRIDVTDTGSGIASPMLARLFEPFTQADGSSSRSAEGTGLGLCISRQLASGLDGSLDVTSSVGVGSCFTLRMRCVAHEAALAPSPAPLLADPSAALTGRRILLVDDNPTNQWLTRRQLVLLGATVDVVAGGAAALDALAQREYDAVITDCHMPGIDGVALTRAIRGQTGPHRDRLVIGLTADVTSGQALRCREAGIDDLLYKPVSRDRLAQLFNRQIPDATPDAADLPVFDTATCRDLFDPGDPDAEVWLRQFCRQASDRVRELARWIDAEPVDRRAIGELAHQLVGASLSVGAARLAQQVRMLEQAAANGSRSELQAMLTVVGAACAAAAASIDAFIGSAEPALS